MRPSPTAERPLLLRGRAQGLAAAADVPTLLPAPGSAAGLPPPAVAAPADMASLLPDRALDLMQGGRWLDDLARDIAATVDRDRLSFRLLPERLGRIDVELTRTDDGMSLHIGTTTSEAHAAMANAQARLGEELRAHGVRLADMELRSGGDGGRQGDGAAQRRAPAAPPQPNASRDSVTRDPADADGRYA